MYQFNVAGMSLDDMLRPREVGELVVSHVLENPKEPTPDYEAMRRAITPALEADAERARSLPKND